MPQWPAEPKVINAWLLMEKMCQLLVYTPSKVCHWDNCQPSSPKTVWQALRGLALLGLLSLVSCSCPSYDPEHLTPYWAQEWMPGHRDPGQGGRHHPLNRASPPNVPWVLGRVRGVCACFWPDFMHLPFKELCRSPFGSHTGRAEVVSAV